MGCGRGSSAAKTSAVVPRIKNASHSERCTQRTSFHDSYNELRFTQRSRPSFHDRFARASTTASPELPRSLPMYCILPRRHCRQSLVTALNLSTYRGNRSSLRIKSRTYHGSRPFKLNSIFFLYHGF